MVDPGIAEKSLWINIIKYFKKVKYILDIYAFFVLSSARKELRNDEPQLLSRSATRFHRNEPADDATTILTLYLPPILTHKIGGFFLSKVYGNLVPSGPKPVDEYMVEPLPAGKELSDSLHTHFD